MANSGNTTTGNVVIIRIITVVTRPTLVNILPALEMLL